MHSEVFPWDSDRIMFSNIKKNTMAVDTLSKRDLNELSIKLMQVLYLIAFLPIFYVFRGMEGRNISKNTYKYNNQNIASAKIKGSLRLKRMAA
ncbi:hypothetical protein EV677_1567 [Herminiimonas fonticola]|uniref:Uncharacterized protein n=2 Tax=Herminiimonas fonticola TaxID=303380 RepID=A0A4R6G6F3_9BURK|nr:hypothetical protein Hfont_2851 [Herminiimonas fonticola]TDN89510.1 hypothetical protein EV677_1567 [Herminiimonas fonticola]